MIGVVDLSMLRKCLWIRAEVWYEAWSSEWNEFRNGRPGRVFLHGSLIAYIVRCVAKKAKSF